ncbi:MAG: TRAP transporter fused permease subunit [Planctomycetota bacterium]
MTEKQNQSGLKSVAFNVLAILLCLFVLVAVNTTIFDRQPNLALFGLLGLLLVFLTKPMVKRWPNLAILKVIDVGLMIGTIAVFGYVFVQSEELLQQFWVDGTLLGERAGTEKSIDFWIAGIGLILVLEATRRAIGWTLPILCVLFIAYAIYGQSMPDWLFPHRGKTWQQISVKTFLQDGGVFGIALQVMFLYVFLFVLFGTMLEQTGATGYVIRFARQLFRKSPGGPAKVAVVSSGLMGSLSGSAVANTATTGTFTIPLMKSSGFNSESAAGVEAAASSGGALMPPIMGAGAYMMLEMVNPTVTYLEIIKAALIPAVLYYFALLLTVHFHSKKIGATAEIEAPENQQDPGQISSYPGFLFFSSFVILIGMLVSGFTPFRAVSVSLLGILILSLCSRHTRLIQMRSQAKPAKILVGVLALHFIVALAISFSSCYNQIQWEPGSGFKEWISLGLGSLWVKISFALMLFAIALFCDLSKIGRALVGAARGGVALIVAASCVGIILGIVDLTGLGPALPAKIQAFANDSGIIALLMLMVSTIILGMGLPSAVCYLLMALLVGSVLKTLETPPLAAHLFIFYFGMMSMVTPPVALAAYAGAAIAKADVMKAAFSAFRFSLVGFALPFAFVLKPELLMLNADGSSAALGSIIVIVLLTGIAICGLAAAIAGYAFKPIHWLFRIVLLGISLSLFFCRWQGIEMAIQIAGSVMIAGMLAWNYRLADGVGAIQTDESV